MCSIIGHCVGGQRTAFKCMCLRSFMLSWFVVYGVVASFELVAGSYLTSARHMVDEILDKLRLMANSGENTGVGDYYYNILQASFETLWKTGTILTASRGCIDVIAGVSGAYGMWKGRCAMMYAFLAINVINFVIDFVLFLASMVLINTLYITYFYPIATIVPFALYGWLALVGPYVASLILSYIWVIQSGGTGAERKSCYDLQDEKASGSDGKTCGCKDIDTATNSGEIVQEKKPLLQSAEGDKDVEAAVEVA